MFSKLYNPASDALDEDAGLHEDGRDDTLVDNNPKPHRDGRDDDEEDHSLPGASSQISNYSEIVQHNQEQPATSNFMTPMNPNILREKFDIPPERTKPVYHVEGVNANYYKNHLKQVSQYSASQENLGDLEGRV